MAENTTPTPRIDWRIALAIGLVAATLLAVGAFLWFRIGPGNPLPKQDATLRTSGGLTEVRPPYQDWRKAASAETVASGSSIRTAADARASLALFEGSLLRLDNDTELTLVQSARIRRDGGQLISVKEDAGQVWYRVMELLSPAAKFTLVTPAANVSAGGTTFRSDVLSNGSSVFYVYKGHISVEPNGGDLFEVSAGHKVVVRLARDTSGIPGVVEQLSDADFDEFYRYNLELDQPGSTSGLPSATPEASAAPTPAPAPAPAAPTPAAPKPNKPPVFAKPGSYCVTDGSLLQFRVHATDPEKLPLTYSCENLPAGATLDPATGAFSWTPVPAQVGSYRLKFVAADARGSSSVSVSVRVDGRPAPPTLIGIGNKFVKLGTTLVFRVTATDPYNRPLTFFASGLPAGATFDTKTGEFRWTPATEDYGRHDVTFGVTNGQFEDTEAISISVTP